MTTYHEAEALTRYKPAKLNSKAFAHLVDRIGSAQALKWGGLIGYDVASHEAIARDGAVTFFHPDHIVLATGMHRTDHGSVVIAFPGSTGSAFVKCFVPPWLAAQLP